MSNAEHAFENAIRALEEGRPFEEWKSIDISLDYVSATAEEIWDMAQYAVYTRCEYGCPYDHNR